ncbi:protein of unknown function [Taphrina deformans PYCC 5710]|uniref:VPS9 domain-containing protein n=1 Tax=Taphrina deformans (strain PYCC 5710 / ATCC 11124 / CBS 356.35 / IMI 108563 / JCM 9778 / NBRC 8474) TaxID=1097556 RepID=R4XE46_TAPDE|nr:protein of unknown function [Taphrina deformans PYCC 5710]|eukprot:CCG84080.1 protein of unknown function [Taphrina deformans PYCC 5710]
MNCPPPNQFLHHLFLKSNSLLANCGSPGSLVILAPVASSLNAIDGETGSVYADDLTDEFVQSHILRITHNKDEVLDRSRARVYNTINGKSMVIKEDVVYPHRGFKGVKEVRILHDSLFWLDHPDQPPYLVYFLDRPLSGALIPDTYLPTRSYLKEKIKDWSGLTSTYKSIGNALNPVFAKLYGEFNEALDRETIDPAPTLATGSFRSRHNSSSSTLQFLRIRVDLILNTAMQAFQLLPQTTLHTISVESHLTGTDIEKLIESHILNDLYDIIFFKLIIITETRDEEIAAAVDRAKFVDISQLGTIATLDLRKRIKSAISKFKDFGREHEPYDKICALMETVNVLMLNSEKSSDDLIPSLVYVVLNAGVSNLSANILWIREFAFMDVDGGEFGFALSTLEAVIYHITSSITSLGEVSERNQRFLEAIGGDDEMRIKEMVEANIDLLETRNGSGKTPHVLASPAILQYFLGKPCTASSLSGLVLSDISSELFAEVLNRILELSQKEICDVLNEADGEGKTLAHKIPERLQFFDQIYYELDWNRLDKQGNTPLQLLARIYDHPLYDILIERVLRTLTCGLDDESDNDERSSDGPGEDHDSTSTVSSLTKYRIPLAKHIDSKGNTLAHIVSTPASLESVFRYCSGDFNKSNDKGLTPLLISIKFARLPLVEYMLARPEVDSEARDSRGHSAIHYAARGSLALFNMCVRAGLDINDRASGSGITALHIASREGNTAVLKRLIELDAEEAWDWRGFRAGDVVKNDAIRGIMDDWACSGREVRVLRGHIGEDCSVKYLIKSKSGGGVLRSVKEFQKLRHWMVTRYPAAGIATLHIHMPSPCQIHSRPSRAVLLAVTERLDAFITACLENDEIKENPWLWEFLLSPTINDKGVADKIESEMELERRRVWKEEKALSSHESTRVFFAHAREQIMKLSSTYRITERKTRAVKDGSLHLSVAYGLVGKALTHFQDLKQSGYVKAIEAMSDSLVAREPSLLYQLIEDIISLDARIQGLLHSLTIPNTLIGRIEHYTLELEKGEKTLSKTPRLQLNLAMLVDSHSRRKALIRDDMMAAHTELEHAGSELRHNEILLADNLSSFYRKHEQGAIGIISKFCGRQAGIERTRLRGMEKALAIVKSVSRGE